VPSRREFLKPTVAASVVAAGSAQVAQAEATASGPTASLKTNKAAHTAMTRIKSVFRREETVYGTAEWAMASR
jgi:hypothetical protein